MIELYKEDGFYKINLEELGITFLSFDVAPLEGDLSLDTLDGVNGEFIRQSQLKSRTAHARILYSQRSYEDFHSNKFKIYELFNPLNTLKIVDTRNPHKIWTMRALDVSLISNAESVRDSEFFVTFFSESPFATSVKKKVVTINNRNAEVFNSGDVRLDARQHSILITYKGASDKLRIINDTTKTEWQYKKGTVSADTLLLDSIYPYKNGVNIFEDTNFGVIEIAKGANKIRLLGATEPFELKFEFYELYI